MARVLDFVVWQCVGCGHKGRLDNAAVEDRLGFSLSIASIASVLDNSRCTRCREVGMRAWREDGTLLIDHDRITPCSDCGLPISLPRLASFPGIRRCEACVGRGEPMQATALRPLPPRRARRCGSCGKSTVMQWPKCGMPFVGCIAFPACWWKTNLSMVEEVECFGSGGYAQWFAVNGRIGRRRCS